MKHLLVLFLLFPLLSSGQTVLEEISTDVGAASPIEPEDPLNVKPGLNPPPRVIEATFEGYGGSFIANTPEKNSLQPASGKIGNFKRWEFKLKLPVYISRNTQVILGGKYLLDEFSFKQGTEYPLYRYMHERQFRIATATLYVNKHFKKHYLISSRSEFGLFGEAQKIGMRQAFRFTQSLLFAYNHSESLAYGIGAYYTFQKQRNSIYPVLYFQKNWTEKIGFMTLFPANAFLRFEPNDNWFLQAGYELGSLNYTLAYTNTGEPVLSGADFRRSDIRPQVKVDREVYEFIMVGVAVGWSRTLFADIKKRDDSGRKRLYDTHFGDPFFVSASLYLSIPEGLRKKI